MIGRALLGSPGWNAQDRPGQADSHTMRRTPSFRVVLVVVATVGLLLAIWTGQGLRSDADRYADADHLTLQLEATAHETATVIWRLVARAATEADARTDFQDSIEEIERVSTNLTEIYQELAALEVDTNRIEETLTDYLASIDRQIVFLEAGDLDSVIQENEQVAARAFVRLDGQVEGLLPLYQERVNTARSLANAGSIVVTVVAAVVAAVVVGWVRTLASSERMIDAKDRFIATVSHELRTPLTGVLGLSRVLTDQSAAALEPGEQQELLLEISRQAQEMGNLVEDLLVSARSEINKLSIQLEPTSLVDAVSEVGTSLGPLLSKTLHIITREDVQVAADPLRLRQIIRNLVMNAERHGGPSIIVRIEQYNGATHLVVADDGDPLSIRDRERIFEPYEHSSQFRSGPTGSVGLGLAVSRELARRMGGDLTYDHHNGFAEFRVQFASITFLDRSSVA